MSLLVFYIVHTKPPGSTGFTKEKLNLRFSNAVSNADAKKYLERHHGKRVVKDGEILSSQFAEITHFQIVPDGHKEVSQKVVFDLLSK